jgi:hypothetical protein
MYLENERSGSYWGSTAGGLSPPWNRAAELHISFVFDGQSRVEFGLTVIEACRRQNEANGWMTHARGAVGEK